MTPRYRSCLRRRALTSPSTNPRLQCLPIIGWQLFSEASYIERCGHHQRSVIIPHADGERAVLVPIFGEAA